jgi:RNA polymerase sigma-70 factor, ECF subfamily
MGHSLGARLGNSWPESSKAPEPTGKRFRRFVRSLLHPRKSEEFTHFPMHAARSISPTGRRYRGHTALKRPLLTLVPGNSADSASSSPSQVLHWQALPGSRGKPLQFQSFDEAYVDRLRAGDYRTQEHFGEYFSTLIQVKLRSRLQSREAIEDVRQETFARFYAALHKGKILHPERLGSFVNSICNNVLLEHYRSDARHSSIEDEEQDVRACATDLLGLLSARETEKKVLEVLDQLSERDRRLLREVFLEERDKDDVCRDFGVDREYLRVLLHRAKQSFKSLYLKRTGNDSPEFKTA